MSVFDRIDGAVKRWLCDCFDVVDGAKYRADIKRSLEDHIVTAEKTTAILNKLTAVCDSTQRVTVEIPSVIAPWYEDKKFSRLLWDELKNKYVTMEDDGDMKYASVIVMSEEGFNDLLR